MNHNIKHLSNGDFEVGNSTNLSQEELANYNFWSGDKVPIKSDVIFVFGSNPEGRHGKGAALSARKHY